MANKPHYRVTQDGLVSMVSGMGTARDKGGSAVYVDTVLTPQEAMNAYHASALVRRVVDLPAEDAVREWRNWQAGVAEIGKVEAEEKRLRLQGKVYESRRAARLDGESALLIGADLAQPEEPLDPRRATRGGLKYLIELGKDVTDWHLGDRVVALVGGGGYAQFATAYAVHLIRIPESVSFQEAACICETYITAYLNLFRIAGLRNGQSVLLHGGGGGVNTAAAHLCHALVPEATVIVTASSAKVEPVRALGVDSVIDYQQRDFPKEVDQITQGRGVDVILD
ncbi:MAG: hypothetical protein CML61_13040, partial [Rhodobacteraceae bacterium]|nr:hypothetical protein [Paracoccaceae bacterium]